MFRKTAFWLDEYFAGRDPGELPPVKVNGTAFQQLVWELLLKIPYGKTVTYRELARSIDAIKGSGRMSSLAVGGAVGKNPVSILIPCHRVVGTKGSLTGYAGGIDKKVRLLELEKVDMTGLFVPEE